jgi:hypothetical protein
MAAATPKTPAAIAGPSGDSERDLSASAVSMDALGAVESTDDGRLWDFSNFFRWDFALVSVELHIMFAFWCRFGDEGAERGHDTDQLREFVRQVWGSEHAAVPDSHVQAGN